MFKSKYRKLLKDFVYKEKVVSILQLPSITNCRIYMLFNVTNLAKYCIFVISPTCINILSIKNMNTFQKKKNIQNNVRMKGMEFGQCKHYKMDEEIIYYKSYRKKNKIRFLLL